MGDTTIILLIVFVLGVGVAPILIVSKRRHRRDLRKYLEPILAKCGVTYVSSVYPGLFDVGPFPKIEIQVGGPQTSILGIRGEYNSYRIVKFKDSAGKSYEVWALVEFKMFQIKRVRWRAENMTNLPKGVLPILEN